MKVFQIYNGICYWDASNVHPTLESIAPGQYPAAVKFVEAPDEVRVGWRYVETDETGPQFLEPVPPEGFLYDTETGSFVQDENYVPPEDYVTYYNEVSGAVDSE